MEVREDGRKGCEGEEIDDEDREANPVRASGAGRI